VIPAAPGAAIAAREQKKPALKPMSDYDIARLNMAVGGGYAQLEHIVREVEAFHTAALASREEAPAASDTFRGDNSALVSNINALLSLDADGALVPHGIGGLARELLSAAASRLSAPTAARSPATVVQPVGWQERQQTIDGWTSWYESRSTCTTGKTEAFALTSGGIPYEFRPLFAQPCASQGCGGAAAIADRVVRMVSEMDDRTSPEDWPEAMLVTGEELHAFILQAFEQDAEATQETEESDSMFTAAHAEFEKRQIFAAPIVGSWPWLRGCINGIPKREESIGGQRARYVALDEVLGWIDEGERRAALSGLEHVGKESE